MLLRWQCSDGGGCQQDAAEQLANLLTMTGMDVALGVRRADLAVAGQLICKAPARTEISGTAVPVDMHEVVLDALRQHNSSEAPKLLVLCLDNTYTVCGVACWVTARVAWSAASLSLKLTHGGSAEAVYRFRGCVVHRHGAPTPAQGMLTGHYVAYLFYGSVQEPVWLEADDDRVRRVSTAPSTYPYIVFL